MSAELSVERRGVCAPLGFRAGTAAACIRGDGDADRLDVAVIASTPAAAAAGVFTRNVVKAAPVVISQLTLRRGEPVGAIVVNSGNANACTGAQGFRDALRMCAATADALDLAPSQVLVCSTGVIGRPMPMDRVLSGIATAATLQDEAGDAAARAIMTTDRVPKTATARVTAGDVTYTVGGMAKGAGMMHPDMATLLAFVTTDAPVQRELLQQMLVRVTDATFNTITVDGDTSTNDTLLLLANGAAGGAPVSPGSATATALEAALLDVCESLAEQLVSDAEGAQRSFRVVVTEAADEAQARAAARTVAGSPLVKTAVHGGDPNWGRVLMALGRSGARFTLDRCTISIAGITVFAQGTPQACDLEALRGALRLPSFEIHAVLGAGEASARAWGCDMGPDYVHINADYTT